MATMDQVVSVSLQKGIDTKTDLKQGINGRLLTLENAVFTGMTDITKRNGYTALPQSILAPGGTTPTSIAAGNSTNTFLGNPVVMDGTNLYSYSQNENAWINYGNKVALDTSSVSLSNETQNLCLPSQATDGVVRFLITPPPVGAATNNLYPGYTQVFKYFDLASNVELFSGTYQITPNNSSSSNAANLKTVQLGNYFLVLMTESRAGASTAILTNGARLFAFPKVPTNQIGSVTTVATYNNYNIANGTTGTSYTFIPDVVVSPTNAFVTTYDGTTVTVRSYDSALTVVNTKTYAISNLLSLDSYYDAVNDELILAFQTTSTVSTAILNATTFVQNPSTSGVGAVNPAGAPVQLSVTVDGGVNMTIYYELAVPFVLGTSTNDTYSIFQVYVGNYRTTPSIVAPTQPMASGYRLYSKPFYNEHDMPTVGIILYQASAVAGQTGIYLVSGINVLSNPATAGANAVARVALNGTLQLEISNINGYSQSNPGMAGLMSNMGSELLYYFTTAGLALYSNGQSVDFPYYTISSVKFAYDQKIRSYELGNNLNISGSEPMLFDGQGIAEQGYNHFPTILESTQSGTGTGNGGQYSYAAIYKWFDAQGNQHRSSPSNFYQVLTSHDIGTGLSVSLAITVPFASSYKQPNVTIDLYRTTANGITYFYVGTVTPFGVFQSPVPAIPISDLALDSHIQAQSQLYTNGGEVSNIAPPSYRAITSFKNRLIVVDKEDPYAWWFSKQVIEGFPVEFSDFLVQNIDQKGGPITALATMDAELVFFKQSNIWYVTGDGPAPNGANNDFIYPQLISSDTGCTNQDSIILTPKGLIFQSPKGIYLLDRGFGMSYIGAPVEAYNQYTVTSVQMISGTTQIRFTLGGIDTTLVYDYLVDQWSTFRNISAVDSTIYKGAFSYLTADGQFNIETPGLYLDNGATIPMNFTTGWLKLSDIQGFERFKKMLIIGTSSGLSTIGISFNYDYNASNLVNIQPIPVAANLNRMQYRVFPPRQKCEAFQLVYVETPATSSAGVTQISNLALEIGMKKGPFKIPAAQSFG